MFKETFCLKIFIETQKHDLVGSEGQWDQGRMTHTQRDNGSEDAAPKAHNGKESQKC